jgi:hypothetical protein
MTLRCWVAGGRARVVMPLVWGVAIEPRIVRDVRQVDAPVPGLPPSLEGVRLAVIADIQVGMWLANRAMVRRAVDEIIAGRPDFVCIGSDFIYAAVARHEQQERDVVGRRVATGTQRLPRRPSGCSRWCRRGFRRSRSSAITITA